jgi:hypothetical protein
LPRPIEAFVSVVRDRTGDCFYVFVVPLKPVRVTVVVNTTDSSTLQRELIYIISSRSKAAGFKINVLSDLSKIVC